MPRGFVFPGLPTCEFFTALRETPANSRFQHQYGVLARLKPGVTLDVAWANMSTITRRLEQQSPDTNKGWGVLVSRIRDVIAQETRTPGSSCLRLCPSRCCWCVPTSPVCSWHVRRRELARWPSAPRWAPAVIGVMIGIPAALAALHFMSSLLYGIGPHDLPVYVTVAAGLIVVALAASYLPARKAATVEPTVALRCE